MLDVIMIASLGASFLLLYGFLVWCGKVVGESGGDREWSLYPSSSYLFSVIWFMPLFIRRSF